MKDEVQCLFCGEKRKQITAMHVQMHGFTGIKEYIAAYPEAQTISKTTLENRRKSRGIKINNPSLPSEIQHNFNISKARTKQRITYEEFLELIKSNTLKELKDQGISKHQIDFFSSLSQNKFNITREQLDQEYESGKSLEEIAQRYNIERGRLTQLRDYWGIKRRGPKYINRKKTEKPLSNRQKEIIYGGLMGDAAKMSLPVLRMKQSVKQKDYLLWKYEQLKEHVSPISLQEETYWHELRKSYYSSIRFYTNATTDIETIMNEFYHTGKKKIDQGILDKLSVLSVAIWFMDDGKTDWSYVQREKTGRNIRPQSRFCSESFSPEENELICKWFNIKWNIPCYVTIKDEKYHRTTFNIESTEKLHNLIRPYIIPSMMYKIDYEAYKVWRKNKELLKLQEKQGTTTLIKE